MRCQTLLWMQLDTFKLSRCSGHGEEAYVEFVAVEDALLAVEIAIILGRINLRCKAGDAIAEVPSDFSRRSSSFLVVFRLRKMYERVNLAIEVSVTVARRPLRPGRQEVSTAASDMHMASNPTEKSDWGSNTRGKG